MTNGRTHRTYEQNDADQTEPERQEHPRIAGRRKFGDEITNHRENNQIAENTDHPVGDLLVLVQAFRTAVGPVRAP